MKSTVMLLLERRCKARVRLMSIISLALLVVIVVLTNSLIQKSQTHEYTQEQYNQALKAIANQNAELESLRNAEVPVEPNPSVDEAYDFVDDLVSVEYLGDYTITYYCPEQQCSDEWGNMTSTGVTAQEGITVAVDPKVIPYGSLLYIEGIGYRIAQDCGGAIKGNKIDVYVDNHEDENGIHGAKVYIIKTGGTTNEQK